jgi:hypothetical protein
LEARTRRNLAVLTSAASLAAGVLAATAPQAGALTISATTGQISTVGADGVHVANPDGSGSALVPGLPDPYGMSPNWAPDGSRLVGGTDDPGTFLSTRTVGTASPVTTGWPTGGAGGSQYSDAVYWLDGSYLVTSDTVQLFYGPSDASFGQQPLLTGANAPAQGTCDRHPTASILGPLAFQRSACGSTGSDIYALDPSTNTLQKIVTDGAEPAYSADGSQLAFTRLVDGHRQIFVAAADGSDPKQITTDASDHHDPAWDPAGGRIAYDVVTDAASDKRETHLLDLADGSTSLFNGATGRPAWQPVRNNTLDRVYGTGDITIDQAASRFTFDTTGATHQPGLITAHSAVLVNKGNGTYAAPAVSLAAEKQGPVLMTSATSLDATAVAELKRTLPKGSTVYLMGNTNLLSANVASQITALGYTALRMDGTDLAAVSARTATQITHTPDWVFVADGMDYHDPIAAASAAGALGYKGLGVVLLTKGTTIPSSVQNYLNSLDPNTTNLVSVGANARTALENTALAKPWQFYDVSGSSNEQTAVNLAEFWWSAPNAATVQDTWTWQNAVTGNAVTATYGPVLWSTVDVLSDQSKAYLTTESASVQEVATFGGNDAYSPTNRSDIGNAIGIDSAHMTTLWWAGGVLPAATGSASKSLAKDFARSLPTVRTPQGQAPVPARKSLTVDIPGAQLPPRTDSTRR